MIQTSGPEIQDCGLVCLMERPRSANKHPPTGSQATTGSPHRSAELGLTTQTDKFPYGKTTHGIINTQFSNPPLKNSFYITQFLRSDLARLCVLQRIRSQHGRRGAADHARPAAVYIMELRGLNLVIASFHRADRRCLGAFYSARCPESSRGQPRREIARKAGWGAWRVHTSAFLPFLLLHLSGQLLPQPSPPDVHNHKGAQEQTRRLDSQITPMIPQIARRR